MESFDDLINKGGEGRYPNKEDYLKVSDGGSAEGYFVEKGATPFYQKYGLMGRFEHKLDKEYSWKLGTTFVLVPSGEKKAWTIGSKVWNQVKKLRVEHGKDVVIKVNRIGSGKENTVYFLQFVRAMTPEEIVERDSTVGFSFGFNDPNATAKNPKGPDTNPEGNAVVPMLTEDELDFS